MLIVSPNSILLLLFLLAQGVLTSQNRPSSPLIAPPPTSLFTALGTSLTRPPDFEDFFYRSNNTLAEPSNNSNNTDTPRFENSYNPSIKKTREFYDIYTICLVETF
jgi:hypothetical protein